MLDRRLKLDPELREKVLDEASEVDGLPGLVRPITLNMLGLVLQQFRGGALARTAPGRLIHDYLRQAMAKPGIDALAPLLLAAMITDKGTKRPADQAALATATGSTPGLCARRSAARPGRGRARARRRARHLGGQPRLRRQPARPDPPAPAALALPPPADDARARGTARLAGLCRSWPSPARRSWTAWRECARR